MTIISFDELTGGQTSDETEGPIDTDEYSFHKRTRIVLSSPVPSDPRASAVNLYRPEASGLVMIARIGCVSIKIHVFVPPNERRVEWGKIETAVEAHCVLIDLNKCTGERNVCFLFCQ